MSNIVITPTAPGYSAAQPPGYQPPSPYPQPAYPQPALAYPQAGYAAQVRLFYVSNVRMAQCHKKQTR